MPPSSLGRLPLTRRALDAPSSQVLRRAHDPRDNP
eukprot:CAMPEP_0174932826 /NCGR_PEP_ID=MMETSP1355-20121228/41828_1 /TAXON_ID=464990 /ORGANISM="Hemiselmis tepida, Strain CCMP443" /LENGTH=34 /DNA_ID= /DNA_START= /DNA_END= /DNA_ORIENTATION=